MCRESSSGATSFSSSSDFTELGDSQGHSCILQGHHHVPPEHSSSRIPCDCCHQGPRVSWEGCPHLLPGLGDLTGQRGYFKEGSPWKQQVLSPAIRNRQRGEAQPRGGGGSAVYRVWTLGHLLRWVVTVWRPTRTARCSFPFSHNVLLLSSCSFSARSSRKVGRLLPRPPFLRTGLWEDACHPSWPLREPGVEQLSRRRPVAGGGLQGLPPAAPVLCWCEDPCPWGPSSPPHPHPRAEPLLSSCHPGSHRRLLPCTPQCVYPPPERERGE